MDPPVCVIVLEEVGSLVVDDAIPDDELRAADLCPTLQHRPRHRRRGMSSALCM